MATLLFLVATLRDPPQAALVLAIVLLYRGPQPILVAATIAAVASETISVLAAVDYTWGEWLAPRLISSALQAAVLCWVVRLIWPRRVGGVPEENSGPLAPHLSRLAPWHMRTFVRRRLVRLRER